MPISFPGVCTSPARAIFLFTLSGRENSDAVPALHQESQSLGASVHQDSLAACPGSTLLADSGATPNLLTLDKPGVNLWSYPCTREIEPSP